MKTEMRKLGTVQCIFSVFFIYFSYCLCTFCFYFEENKEEFIIVRVRRARETNSKGTFIVDTYLLLSNHQCLG